MTLEWLVLIRICDAFVRYIHSGDLDSAAERLEKIHVILTKYPVFENLAEHTLFKKKTINTLQSKIEDLEMEDKREKEQENEVWAAIRDRIQSGNDRADKMKAWLTNRPPIYAQIYADMQARGELVTERDGKKYRLRFTNAAERNHAPNTVEIHMDLKDVVIFDDSRFRTFAEGSGNMNHFNLSLNKADAAEFNEIARKLDIDPCRLFREALRFLARAYSVSPEVFIAESKRCHTLKAQALTRAMDEMDHYEEIEK